MSHTSRVHPHVIQRCHTEGVNPPSHGSAAGTAHTATQDAAVFVRGLFDPRLGLTPGMLGTIYRIGFVVALVPPGLLVLWAFDTRSVLWGLVCAALFPLLYLGLVSVLRIALGFAVALLRLIEQLTRLPDSVDRLTLQVDNLRTDVGRLPESVDELTGHLQGLPTVVSTLNGHIDSLQGSLDSAQFWRGPRRRRLEREAAAAPEAEAPSVAG